MNLIYGTVKCSVFCLLVCGFLSGCSKKSQVTEPGPVNFTELGSTVEGTLTLDKSPYWITKDLVVDSNTTLKIAEGVHLYFADSATLNIKGQLVCQGSKSNPILFSSKDKYWNGMIFKASSQTSTLQFVVVENVDLTIKSDTSRNGAIDISHADVTIRNSIFRNNRSNNGGAIAINQSNSIISNNIFYNNYASVYGGAILSMESASKIINNTFYKNRSYNYGGALVLVSPMFEEVQNNIFYQNSCGSGDTRISYLRTDSTHYNVQYNFMNLETTPSLFVSVSDLHLADLSLCINTGNPSVLYNDSDGTRNDQGAYGGPLGGW